MIALTVFQQAYLVCLAALGKEGRGIFQAHRRFRDGVASGYNVAHMGFKPGHFFRREGGAATDFAEITAIRHGITDVERAARQKLLAGNHHQQRQRPPVDAPAVAAGQGDGAQRAFTQQRVTQLAQFAIAHRSHQRRSRGQVASRCRSVQHLFNGGTDRGVVKQVVIKLHLHRFLANGTLNCMSVH